VKIARRFNGGKEICEKKQGFEARRSTEKTLAVREDEEVNGLSPRRN
jgi:hypothetical protein